MAGQNADGDDIEAEMDRLAAALERIAERSEMAMPRATAITGEGTGADSHEAAQRLDSLIGKLRAAVAGT